MHLQQQRINRLILAGIAVLMIIGCKDLNSGNTIALYNTSTNQPIQNTNSNPNLLWKKWVNTDVDSLPNLYTKNAYIINSDGSIIQGTPALIAHYKDRSIQVEDIVTKTKITAVLNSAIRYEIGGFSTSDKTNYTHFIIWRMGDGEQKRELEMIIEASDDTAQSDLDQINKRRAEWIRLCNLHRSQDLVNNLYAENTLYYNHRPMIIGRNSVIQEYQYMNSPDYKLHLEPLHIELVTSGLAYEIGQCSGTYPGNYVLIWQKESDGEWRILLDTNI